MFRSVVACFRRTGAIGALLAGTALASLPVGACRSAGKSDPPASTSRPNILFVFTDDHASHAISAYGSGINTTPQIDRLAAGGVLFRNCFVGNSICAPSRATILTGKHSHVNGVIDNGNAFDGAQLTFPKLLQGVGYETAMIGKWHLKSDPTGFDYWRVLIGQGPYYNPPLKSAAGIEKHIGYTTDILTDLALEWMAGGRDTTKPFLLMLQHKAPHRNWQPGPAHLNDYDDVTIPEPATLFDDGAGRSRAFGMQEMTVANHLSDFDLKLTPPRNLTPEQLAVWNAAYEVKNAAYLAAGLEGEEKVRWMYQRYLKDYLRCIDSVDDNLGRVLDYLEESGLVDDTVVVYSSDQGFYLGDHGWYDKRWMYEESLRMPLIVRWPGVTTPGVVEEHLAQNLDFAETFLEIAGVKAPEEMQGESLVPLLRGEDPDDWRESLYYHYFEFPAVHMVNRHYGVRTARYKLIRYYELDEWELFDLEADPDELSSVHGDPAYAEVRAELEAELRRLQEQYGDTEPERPRAEFHREAALRRAARVEVELVFDGNANVEMPARLEALYTPLTLGATCTSTGPEGVIAAHGGETFGYALYVKDGHPGFCVRENRRLREVHADASLVLGPIPYHLVGGIDADGSLFLYVDGVLAAEGPGYLLSRAPSEGLSIGRDAGSAVGDWKGESPLSGKVRDLRLYWGRLDEKSIAQWAIDAGAKR